MFYDRTKLIDVRFHCIRDIIEREIVLLEKIHTNFNPADMGTKCLPMENMISCQRILNFDLG